MVRITQSETLAAYLKVRFPNEFVVVQHNGITYECRTFPDQNQAEEWLMRSKTQDLLELYFGGQLISDSISKPSMR